MTMEAFLERLTSVRSRSAGIYVARCPAHQDKSPSLSIRESTDRILIHCFALCDKGDIVNAMGLTMRDLFFDTLRSPGQGLRGLPRRLNLVDVAFQFELGALDRRLRADAVLQAVGSFNGEELTDPQRDQLMNVVARAYADRDRAEFLEANADRLKLKALHERTDRDAA